MLSARNTEKQSYERGSGTEKNRVEGRGESERRKGQRQTYTRRTASDAEQGITKKTNARAQRSFNPGREEEERKRPTLLKTK